MYGSVHVQMKKDCEPHELPGQNPDHVFIICMALREGFTDLWMELEWEFFRPGTLANEEYEVLMVKFPSFMPQLWMVTVFPQAYLEVIRPRIEARSLKLSSGVPILVGGDEAGNVQSQEPFLIPCAPNVYTMERAGFGIEIIGQT